MLIKSELKLGPIRPLGMKEQRLYSTPLMLRLFKIKIKAEFFVAS